MDFDHLLNTSWGQAGFKDDLQHFPLYYTPAKTHSPPGQLEMIKTPTGAIKPVLRTPRFLRSSGKRTAASKGKDAKGQGKPPAVAVNTDGYSFKKKRKRRHHRRHDKPTATTSRQVEGHGPTPGTTNEKGGKPPATGRSREKPGWTTVKSRSQRKKSAAKEHASSFKPQQPIF